MVYFQAEKHRKTMENHVFFVSKTPRQNKTQQRKGAQARRERNPELQIGENWHGPRGVWRGLRDLAGRSSPRDFLPCVLALILTRPQSACAHPTQDRHRRPFTICSATNSLKVAPEKKGPGPPARFGTRSGFDWLVSCNAKRSKSRRASRSGAARENHAPCQFSPI